MLSEDSSSPYLEVHNGYRANVSDAKAREIIQTLVRLVKMLKSRACGTLSVSEAQ